ncbi:uncharacterized protein JCM15063_002759 [Sporobolomyces koalae]|uniref:uncharacterized protein n=1 Tax=Sporobolomyces koalae TaxID=500713 RepID=UPI00317F6DC4
MILIPASLQALLAQLTSRQGTPHTSILTSITSGGSIVSAHTVTNIERPFPSPFDRTRPRRGRRTTHDDDDDDDQESDEEESEEEREARIGTYAALALGTWNEQSDSTRTEDPLMLETEVGRIAVVAVSSFLLILVGTRVTPWKVLDKKVRAASEYLKEPLSRIST